MRLQTYIISLMICFANCTYQKIRKHYHNEYIPDETLIRKRCGPHSTICGTVDNYPLHLVHQHMKKTGKHLDLLQSSEHVSIGKNIGVADGDSGRGETEMCKSRKEYISAQAGVTKNDEWKYIFNNGEFEIEAVYCQNPGGDCMLSFPGFATTCEQKYFYKTLTALNPSGITTTDEFKVPAGCVCSYKRL